MLVNSCYVSQGMRVRFQTAIVPSKSFKGIGNGAVRWATYDFLLVLHCNCVSSLSRDTKTRTDIKNPSGTTLDIVP